MKEEVLEKVVEEKAVGANRSGVDPATTAAAAARMSLERR